MRTTRPLTCLTPQIEGASTRPGLPGHPQVHPQLSLENAADHLGPAGHGEEDFSALDTEPRQPFGEPASLSAVVKARSAAFLAVAQCQVVDSRPAAAATAMAGSKLCRLVTQWREANGPSVSDIGSSLGPAFELRSVITRFAGPPNSSFTVMLRVRRRRAHLERQLRRVGGDETNTATRSQYGPRAHPPPRRRCRSPLR